MNASAHSGFTLLELIITLIIVGIIVTFGIPSLTEVVENNRISSQVNEVSSAINFSRSEASKVAGATITVCPVNDVTDATPDCNGGSVWGSGWAIILDVDGDGVFDAGDGDQLLKVHQPLAGGNTMEVSGLSSNDGSLIQFAGNGFPVPPALGAPASGAITICDGRGQASARAVVVNVSGQTRLARDTDNDGILNDHNGANVTCP